MPSLKGYHPFFFLPSRVGEDEEEQSPPPRCSQGWKLHPSFALRQLKLLQMPEELQEAALRRGAGWKSPSPGGQGEGGPPHAAWERLRGAEAVLELTSSLPSHFGLF